MVRWIARTAFIVSCALTGVWAAIGGPWQWSLFAGVTFMVLGVVGDLASEARQPVWLRDPSADLPASKGLFLTDGYETLPGHPRSQHLNGVPHNEAPIPDPTHRCWGQSVEFYADHNRWLCPCGAERISDSSGRGVWRNRNSRCNKVAPS